MSNIGMTEDSIAMAIIFNREAHDLVEQHVRKLQDMGILELGIKSDKLDDLMAKLRAAGVLDGEFAFLDAAQKYLFGDFVADINRQIAAILAAAGGVTMENLKEHVAKYMEEIESPKNSQLLYLEVMALPYKNFQICMQALTYASCKPNPDLDHLESLVRYLAEVIPVGNELPHKIPSKQWIMDNRRKYIRVDFSPVIKAMPFADTYRQMFNEALVQRAGSNKSIIEGKAIDYLKLLVLEDVFKVLEKDREKTSPRINEQIVNLVNERFMYVCMRFVQAMVMAQADLLDTIRMQEAEKITAEARPKYVYNGPFGNIPS